jgi:hypothetical protein
MPSTTNRSNDILNCKEAGDPLCTQTIYGETEEVLLANAKSME